MAAPAVRMLKTATHIAVDKENNVYANAYRFLMRKDGSRGYNAKMLAVSEEG